MTLLKLARITGFIALAAIAGSAFSQAQPERGIVRVAGDLYRAQNNQHYTVFLVTPAGIILSDTINEDFSEWLKNELDTRFGLPVRYVLYSHHHWDHASGGRVFADTAEFVGQAAMQQALAMPSSGTPLPADAAAMDRNRNGRLESSEATGGYAAQFENYDDNRDGALSGAEIARGPIANVYPANRHFDDRTTISLGGKSVEMIHIGPTHAPDMSVLRFPDEDAAFLVDFISAKRLPFQNLPDVDVDELISTIRRVEGFDFSIVVGGHGAIGTKADVAAHREYIEELRDAVAAGLAAGLNLEQLKATIDMGSYSDWTNYAAWLPLNIEGMHRILTAEN